jgi:hypothetical protein
MRRTKSALPITAWCKYRASYKFLLNYNFIVYLFIRLLINFIIHSLNYVFVFYLGNAVA